MIKNKRNLLHTIQFMNLDKWSARDSVFENMDNHFPLVPLSKVLKRVKEPVIVEDETIYKRITVRLYGQGVLKRDDLFGKEIGTKRQYLAHADQLIISRIDARNGAFGIVPKELDGAIVTNDFWLFDVQNALPEYLMLVLSSGPFQKYWQAQSSGTTNRQRVDEDSFLSSLITLPDIQEQIGLFNKYNATKMRAEKAEEKSIQLSNRLSAVLMDKLGLQPIELLDSSSILHFSSFREISSKWEWNPLLSAINNSLTTSKYPVLPLDRATRLVNRRWDRKSEESSSFKYIEISSIDADNNTAKANVVRLEDAPSRATQTVKAGDLIIGTTRPYLKRFALISQQQNNYVCSSGFQVIEKDQRYDLEFVLETIKLDPIIKQFEYLMTGALYPAINSEQIKKIRIPMPPIETQKEILKELKRLKMELQMYREQSERLRFQAKKSFEEAVFG